MGLRVGGRDAHGHTVRRAVPDASISRPWISVSAQGQVYKHILNLILRTSHNPMEGKSTENWPVLVQSVNVTKDRKRAKGFPI